MDVLLKLAMFIAAAYCAYMSAKTALRLLGELLD
jgi:hypothetical protein